MTEEEVIREIGLLAKKYYSDTHYSCAEAIVKAFAEVFAPHRFNPDTITRIATPLNGGFSELKKTCGVLTSGFLAIGIVAGREKPGDEDAKEEAYTLAQIYHNRFMESVGTDSCQELLLRWNTQGEEKTLCKEHTQKMAEMLAKTILQVGFHDLELD
ncbi:MAG: C_GCAxxG_C_C family protein [Magnetococcales bacterium]|nr:C_GCAxxG_C_C family protein [Magnetococcales bacterium]MBF0321716.1 C_GCAxxG_C_C family protein [Magnetococcales bacterium]